MRWIGLAVLGLTGCMVGGGEAAWEFDGVVAVDAHLGSGEMTVVSSPDERARVEWDGGGIGRVAHPAVDVDADGVLLVDAKGGLGGGDLWLEVPAGAPLFVTVDRGELAIELDFPASIDACVAAGELSIGLPPGAYRLDLALAVGAVEQDGLVHDDDSPYVISGCVGAGEVSVYVNDVTTGDTAVD